MTNREKLADLSANIKNLSKDFLKFEELITEDRFGDEGPDELQKYRNMHVENHTFSVVFHLIINQILQSKFKSLRYIVSFRILGNIPNFKTIANPTKQKAAVPSGFGI